MQILYTAHSNKDTHPREKKYGYIVELVGQFDQVHN